MINGQRIKDCKARRPPSIGHLHHSLPHEARRSLRKVDRKPVRAGSSGGRHQNSVFRVQRGSCTYELKVVVTACTGLLKALTIQSPSMNGGQWAGNPSTT